MTNGVTYVDENFPEQEVANLLSRTEAISHNVSSTI
jgi:hypothetical protein